MAILRWIDSFSRRVIGAPVLTPFTISIAPRLAATALSFSVDWCTLHVCKAMGMGRVQRKRVGLCVASAWVVLAMYAPGNYFVHTVISPNPTIYPDH